MCDRQPNQESPRPIIDLCQPAYHPVTMNQVRMSISGLLNALFRMTSSALLGVVFLALNCLSLRADWPEYRGPTGDGHVAAGNKPLGLPLHWSETNNIKWKTPIPYKGWCTPVIMGGQVWLTTATEDGHDF